MKETQHTNHSMDYMISKFENGQVYEFVNINKNKLDFVVKEEFENSISKLVKSIDQDNMDFKMLDSS